MRTPVPVALAGPEACELLGASLGSMRSNEANPTLTIMQTGLDEVRRNERSERKSDEPSAGGFFVC